MPGVSKLLLFEQKVIHVRWSGESTWIPLGDFDLGLGFENETTPAPGEILLYPGGHSETEILLPTAAGCPRASSANSLGTTP